MSVFLQRFMAVIFILQTSMVFGIGEPGVTRLRLEGPVRMPVGEGHYLDLLYFEGAVYADTMPAVPAWSVRVSNKVPHYRTEFRIIFAEFEPMGEEEQKILKASGFQQDSISLHAGTQWERLQSHSVVSFYPFRLNKETGQYEKLVAFSLDENLQYDPDLKYDKTADFSAGSVLASGTWHRVCVDQSGIYRLTHAELSALGVNMQGLQKNQIRLFGNGGGMLPEANNANRPDDLLEQAVFISGSSDGVFGQGDYLLFYGESPNQWTYNGEEGVFHHQVHLYSKENCYFITTGQGTGKRITSQSSTTLPATHEVNTFQDYAYHQVDQINLIGSGRQWFGEVFDATLSRQFTFPFSDVDTGSPAHVRTSLAARSPVSSTFTVRAGDGQFNQAIPPVDLLDYINFYARNVVGGMWFTPDQANQIRVNITYNRPASTSRGWLDFVAVNVTRHLRFSGSQMAFRNPGVAGPGNVAEYVLTNAGSQVRVWDVTDRFNIRQQEVLQSGNSQVFRLPADSIRELLAFNGTAYLEARLAGRVENQNLHAMKPADLIIVSPAIFLQQAERLAEFRRANDGLSVHIVTPQQIYNEFSSGATDVSAIRNFMKMFYDRAKTPDDLPRYLLLFGNGTIDNKDLLGFGGNLIPTYQSQASLSPSTSFMTDDYFGLLADSEGQGAAGLLDLGIGRLPVRTPEEAEAVVSKIIRYDKRMDIAEFSGNPGISVKTPNHADWRNMVVFVADDGDFNTHFNHAERLGNIVEEFHPYYNLEKIYLDAYQMVTLAGGSRYPQVNQAINDRVNKGALLINYIGHGGVNGLAHQRVVTFEDIETWNNTYNLPVFMTATCEFSSFDQPDPKQLSAGVRILLKPDGGAAALYTTTRLAWSGTNLTLNENFMRNAFRPVAEGNYPRLGDLIRIAKVESDGNVQPWRLKNFVLLGDPSMRMAYPEYAVVTESIPDTLRAFQKVTVSGYIMDRQGNLASGYNGLIYPTVYDKKNTYQTLANAPGSNTANFSMRNSMIYRGKASVEDGRFSFSFVVPKDIAYHYGEGKISYYIYDGHTDGHGYDTGFIIGGTMEGFTPDNTGPVIDLFMNDTTFISGGTTNENPVLLAFLSDESGINIRGSIGHDIVAFLNDDTSRPIVLNAYFEGDLDSYRRGRVVYPFRRLEEGLHRITLRAWDIHNNPSVKSIDFIVARSAEAVLQDLVNYPNPFGSGTHFTFSHNLPFSDLDVRIEVFDLQGRLLKGIETRVQSSGFRSPPIFWDGTSDQGKPIGNGIYIYRLILTTPDGKQREMTERLVILRGSSQ
jgi:hypothetical protein